MRRIRINSNGRSLEELILKELILRRTWLTASNIRFRLKIDCDPPITISSRMVASILLKIYEGGFLERRFTAKGSDRYSYRLLGTPSIVWI